jgi:integrase
MGHSSIKITVDTYGHLIPGANKAAVDRLDDATGRNLYATSGMPATRSRRARRAYMADSAIKVYYRPG